MENSSSEYFPSPKITVKRNPEYQIQGHILKGFTISDEVNNISVIVSDNRGSQDSPYELVATSTTAENAGKLFFDLANQDEHHPRDIYAKINGAILRFNPAETIPVQVFQIVEKNFEDTARYYQKEILEKIKPGLSNILFNE